MYAFVNENSGNGSGDLNLSQRGGFTSGLTENVKDRDSTKHLMGHNLHRKSNPFENKFAIETMDA